jgi:hypothetical protein
LTSTHEEIHEYFNGMFAESRAIEKQTFEICWYMRGGITLEEAWQLSYDQRATINGIIEKNVERTKESGLALL